MGFYVIAGRQQFRHARRELVKIYGAIYCMCGQLITQSQQQEKHLLDLQFYYLITRGIRKGETDRKGSCSRTCRSVRCS